MCNRGASFVCVNAARCVAPPAVGVARLRHGVPAPRGATVSERRRLRCDRRRWHGRGRLDRVGRNRWLRGRDRFGRLRRLWRLWRLRWRDGIGRLRSGGRRRRWGRRDRLRRHRIDGRGWRRRWKRLGSGTGGRGLDWRGRLDGGGLMRCGATHLCIGCVCSRARRRLRRTREHGQADDRKESAGGLHMVRASIAGIGVSPLLPCERATFGRPIRRR